MAQISVRSRAHRTLKRLSNFTTDASTLGLTLERLALRPEEELIGAYQNSRSTGFSVVVTSSGLHLVSADGSRYVPFRSITRVDSPSNKDDVGDLVLSLASGDKIVVPIRGGRGRFKDVFEFERFVARVLEDQSRKSEL